MNQAAAMTLIIRVFSSFSTICVCLNSQADSCEMVSKTPDRKLQFVSLVRKCVLASNREGTKPRRC